jgi:hypothetical protein
VLPDQTIVAFGLDDAGMLALLSSKQHTHWALAAGGWRGVGNDPRYTKSRCFDPFPFPDLTPAQHARLSELGEALDQHRKSRQTAHPKLTMTTMYNVLAKLRNGDRLDDKDREAYDQGLIGILRDIHDRIDGEVATAYGWPADLSEDEILLRLVALNHTRAAEEAKGLIRWLRPEYQNPAGAKATAANEQTSLDVESDEENADKTPWPKSLPEQIAAVRRTLSDLGEATPEQVARRFVRVRTTSVRPLLESLSALGQARVIEGGRFAA